MTTGVSVIICCYNSVSRLHDTLTHLLKQKYSGFGFEIIIVDNASTDETSAFAEKLLSNQTGISYTVVNEPESGLSFARKRGYITAQYGFLLYCDDDNRMDENYLQLTYDTMMANAKIGILGGFGEAAFESPPPPWFKQYEIDFAIGDQSAAKESLSQVNEVYGAGFTIRKSYLDKLYGSGFKSILSDRKGNQLISGGDVEFCYLAKYFGYEVWYHRGLKFKHYMTLPRLNWAYMQKLYAANGKTNVYTQAYQYIEKHDRVPGQNLRFPFWLDAFLHKLKALRQFRKRVKHKMSHEGDAEVLRYIAMKAEAVEIWKLKGNYSGVYQTIYNYLHGIDKQLNLSDNPVK
jgi:glycosyltransferase involved in cell wall biosynthesis